MLKGVLRMKRYFIFIFLISFSILSGCGSKSVGETKTVHSYNGWTIVKVGEIATFQIPPTMEVQSDAYRQKAGDLGIVVNNENIVCQQKGLNQQEPGPSNKMQYARVLFVTTPMQPAGPDYGQPLGISSKDLKNLETLLKQSIIQDESKVAGNRIKFLHWLPLAVVKINGIECLHISYERQLQSNPVVKVDNYKFFNKDKIHNFTISSRISEKNIWHAQGQDIDNIVNTLRINSR